MIPALGVSVSSHLKKQDFENLLVGSVASLRLTSDFVSKMSLTSAALIRLQELGMVKVAGSTGGASGTLLRVLELPVSFLHAKNDKVISRMNNCRILSIFLTLKNK